MNEEFKNLKRTYMRVFNSPDGQKILKDLESRCLRYLPTYDGDVYQAMINEGKRQTLSHIETMLLPMEQEQPDNQAEEE